MPFKNTDKSECLTVYSGACISLSLQIPKSRKQSVWFFQGPVISLNYFKLMVPQKMGCWFYFSGLLLHKPPQTLSTTVFSLSRLKAHMEALTSKAMHIQQGLSTRLTVPKPLSWRSDFISWRHQRPFMIFLGLILVRANSIHLDCHPCSPF